MKAPIALALDAPSDEIAIEWAVAVAPIITTVKVGLELFVRYGPDVVRKIRAAAPDLELFLDLKLHDIPNTVAGASRAISDLAPEILTVHASGGREMVRSAASTLPQTQVAAVTVLTSLDDEDLRDLHFALSASDQALVWAENSVNAGARAIVCSPHEARAMRQRIGADVRLITPGVRPSGSDNQDQSRVATPQQALHDGADLLVIGRPITGQFATGGAAAIAEAAANIAASIR